MDNNISSLVFMQYLATVFDHVDQSILLLSVEPEGRYKALFTNKSFGRLSGFPNDLSGKYLDEVASPEFYADISQRYLNAIHAKETLQYFDWHPVPNGKRAYEAKIIPILNTVGECAQLLVISRDVTDQEQLRQKLQDTEALNKSLLRRINPAA